MERQLRGSRRHGPQRKTFRVAARAAGLFVAVSVLPTTLASAQATEYANVPPVLLGAAWYPEQWPESVWERDLQQMEAAHIHLARIAEFAWSSMEPSEGNYQFTWLDHAIEQAAKHHVVIVLGTPTPTPPAWMTTKYPEILRVDENGQREEHGNRQQFSFTSRKYRELARGIAQKMAERYGHNPNVVGWQLDNEISGVSFDPETKAQWHAWLKAKYGTVDKLNQEWTTAYWSESYDSFDEVPAHEKYENPGLLLDWRHFVTDTWVSYCQNQIDVIRPHADKRQFITTNTMGWFDGFDAYKVHKVLDIAAWDDYIGGPVYDVANNGAAHDLTRSYKKKNFWVMETEPAFVNWRKNNTPLEKGQVRDMAWQAVGHGADAVEYWQWRSALSGQEQYHGTLVGADGTPVPVYDEVKQVGAEFEKTGAALAGTSPHATVAVAETFDSRWAIDFQRFNESFEPVEELVDFYRPLREGAQAVDIVEPTDALTGYKLVVAPALNVLTEAQAQNLTEYVKGGGHLVLGPRSGMKNGYNALWPERQPGPLADLLGGRVDEWYTLLDGVTTPVSGKAGTGSAKIWQEILSARSPETQTLATYGKGNGWVDGKPAILTRKVGRGSITYVGFWPDAAMLQTLANGFLQQAGVSPLVPNAPQAVEVCERTGEGKTVLILINHGTEGRQIALPGPMKDLLGDGGSVNSVNLERFGVAVLSR